MILFVYSLWSVELWRGGWDEKLEHVTRPFNAPGCPSLTSPYAVAVTYLIQSITSILTTCALCRQNCVVPLRVALRSVRPPQAVRLRARACQLVGHGAGCPESAMSWMRGPAR